MSRAIPPPHIVKDDEGRPQLKISAGRPSGFGSGARARYFAPDGARQDRAGRPVTATAAQGFQATVWDLPRPSPAPAVRVDLPAALKLARQSRSFATMLQEIERAGWAIIVASVTKEAGCRKGTNLIAVESGRRDFFVARLVRHVAYARALAAPLPRLDHADEDFARVNAVFLMRCDAEARLAAAQIRDELLAVGAPDIGGPGLRGSQITAYLRLLEGTMTREQAIAAIAASADGVEGRTFTIAHGTRAAVDFARAFDTSGFAAPALPPPVFDVVQRFRGKGNLTLESVARALDARLDQEGKNDFFVTHGATLPGPRFVRAELRVPRADSRVPGLSPRLIITAAPTSDPLRLSSFETFFGKGIPHHLDLSPKPQATVMLPGDPMTNPLGVTYAVGTSAVMAIAFEVSSSTPA